MKKKFLIFWVFLIIWKFWEIVIFPQISTQNFEKIGIIKKLFFLFRIVYLNFYLFKLTFNKKKLKLLHEKPFISAIGRILDRQENLINQQQLNKKISSQPIPTQISPEKSKLYEQIARFQQIRFDEVFFKYLKKYIFIFFNLGMCFGFTKSDRQGN